MKSEKIVVTGCAGFIGYHLCNSLLSDGYEILGIDTINDYYDVSLKFDRLGILNKFNNFYFEKKNIADKDSISKLFSSFKPKIVVNLAAQAGVRYSLKNPYAYLDSNLSGFINIIEQCRQNKIKGLIYASSSSVYGGNKAIPFDENDRVDKPVSLYGATKRANELIAFSYSNLYNLNTTGLRFFTVYGPWGRPDMAMFIFTKNILQKKPIQVFNNGKMKRDFTYIDDIISGIRCAIDKNYACEIFNLGNNQSVELLHMINLIEKEINRKAIIDFQPLQPGDVIESFAEIKKSEKKLNFNPRTSIDIGIKKFIEWYKDYHD
tara:strand:- start:501 stop:1460 length:960 start_codon:yes stop_codon:yes gene_type:complete